MEDLFLDFSFLRKVLLLNAQIWKLPMVRIAVTSVGEAGLRLACHRSVMYIKADTVTVPPPDSTEEQASMETMVEQFEIALGAVDAVLRSQGGEPRNIVKVQVFLTDVSDREKINPVRQRYFGEHRPASTLVQVAALVRPDLKGEIEAEAVLD